RLSGRRDRSRPDRVRRAVSRCARSRRVHCGMPRPRRARTRCRRNARRAPGTPLRPALRPLEHAATLGYLIDSRTRMDLDDASRLLDDAFALHRRACRHVCDNATGDPIDTAQIPLYDLALSAAELEAARVALAYARGAAEQALRASVALTFCGEALTNLGAR